MADEWMVKELVRKGVPRNEIGNVIRDGRDRPKREQMFADTRSGRIRILIGSTGLMGEGVNVPDSPEA